MAIKKQLVAALFFALGGLSVSLHATAQSTITPERYNKGPRILFNMYSDADKQALEKVVPGSFHHKHWQTPRSTVQHAMLIRNKKGEHIKTVAGYHGEEVVIMIDGQLQFSFPDSKQVFVLRKGDVFNFPNILHHGVCLTDECHFMVVYSPQRADFGPEGTPMTVESNIGLNESAGNK